MTPTDDSPRRIVPHFWFDRRAEEASAFYTSLFENSGGDPNPEKVARVTRAFMPMEKLDIATLAEACAG